jgi:WD40 repeat protein
LATTFLSYSRKDIAFAERLDAALKAADQTAWVDWVGIPPTAEFADEINRGIEASDNFLIVLSPDSLDEKSYCRREIAHAAAMHKRIIPVYFRTVAQETVPECVASLNYIFFRETDDFEAAFAKLLAALHTDLLWMSMSSRLLVRALEWDRQGRDNSFVLRDKDLAKAEAWLAEAASKEGKPTELQTQYIHESRKAATRRQRLVRNVLGGLLALVAAGGGAAVYWGFAAKRQTTVATSRGLAAAALLQKDQNFSLALLLSVEARNTADTFDARNAIVTLWQAWPHLVAYDRKRFQKNGHAGADEEFPVKIVKGSGGQLGVQWQRGRDFKERAVLVRADDGSVEHELPNVGEEGAGDFEINKDGTLLIESGSGVQVWTLSDFASHREAGSPIEDLGSLSQPATFDPAVPGVVAQIDEKGRFGYQDAITGGSRNELNPQRVALINSFLPVRVAPPPLPHSSSMRAQTPAEEKAWAQREEAYEKSLVQQIAFRPQGDVFAFSQHYDISVVDLRVGKVVAHLDASLVPGYTETPDRVNSLSFSPQGDALAARDTDRQLGVWTFQLGVNDGEGWTEAEFDAQKDIAAESGDTWLKQNWQPNGLLKTGSALWSPGRVRGTRLLGDPAGDRAVQFPVFLDPSTIVALDRSEVETWHLQSGVRESRVMEWLRQPGWIGTERELGDDGNFIVKLTSLQDDSVLHLKRWDVRTGRELPDLTDPAINQVGALPHVVATTASRQGDVAISLMQEQPQTNEPSPSPVQGPAPPFLQPVQTEVALFWHANDPSHAEHLSLAAGEKLIALAFRPDGKVLAGVVEDGPKAWVRLWSTDDLRQIRTTALASGNGDYPADLEIVFSPDGSLFEVLGQIYESGKLREVESLPSDFPGGTAAFLPGNRQIAVGATDHSIRLWDVEARRQLGGKIDAGGPTLPRDFDATQGETFSPDGKWMAAAYRGGRLMLWRNPLAGGREGWRDLACSVANRNLTADEWGLYFPGESYRKTCPGLDDGRSAPAQ